MKRVCLIFLLLFALPLCSCTRRSSTSEGAAGLIDGSEKQSVFDMSGRLNTDGTALGAAAVNSGITFEYENALFYGDFAYIPFTISGCDGRNMPVFNVSSDEWRDGPYHIDSDFDKEGAVKGAIYLPMREYKDSIELKISELYYGDEYEEPFGVWEAGIPVKNVSARVLEIEPKEEKTVNVFDAEYKIKKVTLTDFNIRIECRLKSGNSLTEEEIMQKITSSEATGESGYYDSYVQVLYKDGTVSPKYEYCLAEQNVMWAWFLENGQIDAENVRAVYIGGSEFAVE